VRVVAGGAAIEAHGLRNRYGDVVALDDGLRSRRNPTTTP
jgi:hypothetical protein